MILVIVVVVDVDVVFDVVAVAPVAAFAATVASIPPASLLFHLRPRPSITLPAPTLLSSPSLSVSIHDLIP